jgi:hypothetical protein
MAFLASVGAVAAMALTCAASASAAFAHASSSVSVNVSSTDVGPAMPAGFVGIATEFPDIQKEVGTDPTKPDVPFEQLVRNLAPSGSVSLRIGGDSTDWAWWPIPGMKQPPWVRWAMSPAWAAVTKKLADDLHAHLIVGVNMEADNTKVSSAEVNQIRSHLGSSIPVTYELGNEPELYSKFAFYNNTRGQPVLGRPKGYSLTDVTSEWDKIAHALPGVRLAGPGYSALSALPGVSQFLGSSHQISLLTVHSYPLKSTRCGGKPEQSHLFTPESLQDLATEVNSWTNLARAHSVPVRVDEMNAITCGGMPFLSSTFGPALWALNILPLYAKSGLAGVNFQTRPFSAQNLMQAVDTASGWQVQIQPEYYGLLAFAQLTPPGSHIVETPPLPGALYDWAVQTPQGQTHVVVTNVGSSTASAAIQAAGSHGPATVEFLRAASNGLNATSHITLGGQAISPSTGELAGAQVTTKVPSTHGAYDVAVPAASAAIVTFAR